MSDVSSLKAQAKVGCFLELCQGQEPLGPPSFAHQPERESHTEHSWERDEHTPRFGDANRKC